jgi:hypothetical protein
MAKTSITATTSARVVGRLLARNGAVTLDANIITRPTACAATSQVGQVPTGGVSSGDGSTSGGANALPVWAGLLIFAGLGGAGVVAVRRRRLNA